MVQARRRALHLLCVAVTKMNIVLFYIICVVAGMGVDWALYERFTLYVEAWKKIEPNRKYKDILFPRILITVLGLSLIALDPYVSGDHRILLWIGLALFLSSVTYLLIVAYRPIGGGHS